MSFLFPLGLLGLLTIPVIVGLHLHLERNRRVLVSSMFLWQFLDAKFQGQKPKFVRFSWLLVFDITLAVLFSLALAQPQLRLPAFGGGTVQKVVLVDDSVSMLAEDGDPNRFAIAQEVAVGLIEDSNRRDEVMLITMGGDVEVVGTTQETGKRELIQLVRNLSPGGYGTVLRTSLAEAELFLENEIPAEVYVITDGAFPSVDLSDFPFQITWAFIGYEVNNQAVIDLQLDSQRDGSVVMFSRLLNFAPQQIQRDVEVWADGEITVTERLTIAANSALPLTLSLPSGTQAAEVRLLGVDSLPEDDLAAAALSPDATVQVALVTDTPGEVARAVSSVSNAQLTVYAPEDVIPEIIYDLIIYRGMIPAQWPQGTVMVFDPPAGNPLVDLGGEQAIQSPLEQEDHPILESVNLEKVRWGSAPEFLGATAAGEENLQAVNVLASDGVQALLVELKYLDGSKLIFLPNLGLGNFTKDSAFPIMVGNLVSYSQKLTLAGSYLVGEDLQVPEALLSQGAVVKSPSSDVYQPVSEGKFPLEELGTYSLEYTDGLGEVRTYAFGVNAGDGGESDIAPQSWRFEIETDQAELDYGLQMIEVNLGPWLLMLAVGLLLLEAWRAWR